MKTPVNRLMVVATLALATAIAVAAPAAAGQKVSGTLAPVPADCNTGPGFCKNGLNQSFGDCGFDNSLCTGGTTAKSKLSISDKLILKASVKGLRDNDGNLVTTNPASILDDHIIKLGMIRCLVDNGVPTNCVATVDIYVKLDLINGNGSVTADLSQVFAGDPSGSTFTLTSASVRSSASDPFSCTGGNSAAEIAARSNNSNCDSAMPYAVFGVVKK